MVSYGNMLFHKSLYGRYVVSIMDKLDNNSMNDIFVFQMVDILKL